MTPEQRAARACSWDSSTRSRSPASTTCTSCARRSTRCAGSRRDRARRPRLPRSGARGDGTRRDEAGLPRPRGQRRLQRRREEAQRDPPDGGARAALAVLDETDSGLDIDALRIVARGVNALRGPDRSMIVITHYQRLLDYIKPDFVHVLVERQHRRVGRSHPCAPPRGPRLCRLRQPRPR